MRWRRRPTEKQIRSWLDTGAPSWVERWVGDPHVDAQLERLSRLADADAEVLRELVEPAAGFRERTSFGVQSRVGDLERLGVVLDLLALGPRTARYLIEPDPE